MVDSNLSYDDSIDRGAPAGLARLQVIATTEEGTRAALAQARQLADRFTPAQVVLLVPRIVSALAPPEGPREAALITGRYRELVAQAGVDAIVRLCVCQRFDEVCRWMVSKRSPIVVGGRRRWWWHTQAQDIARRLRNTGHQVVFAEVS